MPTVSIGLPVYNGEPYLAQALSSLLQQEFTDFELIISDNASIDHTETICGEYAAQDSRICYSRLDKTVGPMENFNRALSLASGDFFMWAAHDDIRSLSFLATTSTIMNTRRDAGIIFCIPNAIDAEGQVFAGAPKFMNLQGTSRLDGLRRYLLQEEKWGKANAIYGLMRRETVLATGGYRNWTQDGLGADMHFVFKMLTMGQLIVVPEVLFYKRLILAPEPRKKNHSKRPKAMARRIWKHSRWRFRQFHEFNAYLSGYRNVIQSSDLPFAEKQMLLTLCNYRAIKRLWLPNP